MAANDAEGAVNFYNLEALEFPVDDWVKSFMENNHRWWLCELGSYNEIVVYFGEWTAIFARPLAHRQNPVEGDPQELHLLVKDAWDNHVFPELVAPWRRRFLADHSHWVPILQDGLSAEDNVRLQKEFFHYLRDFWMTSF